MNESWTLNGISKCNVEKWIKFGEWMRVQQEIEVRQWTKFSEAMKDGQGC